MIGDFSFDYPLVLLGLIALIPATFYDNFSSRDKMIRKRLPRPLGNRLFFSGMFYSVFFACLIIALAGPRWGIGQAQGEFRRGVDAVIALDVSRSMEIRDGYEDGLSRLDRGLSIVREVVETVPEIRYGIVIGKSGGITAVPLTRDNGVVLDFLETVDTSSITGRGTNLETLIDTAAEAFVDSQPSVRVIVLVSDGEALSGSLKAAVGRCNQRGVTITAVAVGSDDGGEVPGAEGIISRRDSAAMRAAAGLTDIATTGDEGFIDGNLRDAASVLAAQLRSLAPESESPGNKKETKARWLLFTVVAITALGISKICLFNFSLRKSPVLFSIILTLFVCGCSGTSGKLLIIRANFQNSQGRYSEAITAYLKALEYEEAASYAEYGMGSVYYIMGEEKAALNKFSQALHLLEKFPSDTNRELRYRIHYNTGVVLFGEGDFTGAAASFREALRTDGGKVDAKRNLELSIKSHTRRQASGGGNNTGQNESRSESMVVLMDYIKRKELNQWRSRTWQEEETTGPDY